MDHVDKITAQVACEAIANSPEAYSPDTISAVRAAGVLAGVHARYLPTVPACEACGCCEAGHGHFAQFCEACAELPYGVTHAPQPVRGTVRQLGLVDGAIFTWHGTHTSGPDRPGTLAQLVRNERGQQQVREVGTGNVLAITQGCGLKFWAAGAAVAR